MGSAPLATKGAMMGVQQENDDVIGSQLEDAHSGYNVQSELERPRVRMGMFAHHGRGSGQSKRQPEPVQRGDRREIVQKYEEVGERGAGNAWV